MSVTEETLRALSIASFAAYQNAHYEFHRENFQPLPELHKVVLALAALHKSYHLNDQYDKYKEIFGNNSSGNGGVLQQQLRDQLRTDIIKKAIDIGMNAEWIKFHLSEKFTPDITHFFNNEDRSR